MGPHVSGEILHLELGGLARSHWKRKHRADTFHAKAHRRKVPWGKGEGGKVAHRARRATSINHLRTSGLNRLFAGVSRRVYFVICVRLRIDRGTIWAS